MDRRVLSVKGAGWQEAWFKAEVRGGKKGHSDLQSPTSPHLLGLPYSSLLQIY